ncbi:MAG: gliding motility-associated C-terminal domain-containing protein [Flavobacteriales bacterium]|nr:gliding motility-associated C-terminal domain-containing protein [Flavobacteriales bacterium]
MQQVFLKNLLKIGVFLLAFIFVGTPAKADHIVEMRLSYKHISGSTYQVNGILAIPCEELKVRSVRDSIPVIASSSCSGSVITTWLFLDKLDSGIVDLPSCIDHEASCEPKSLIFDSYFYHYSGEVTLAECSDWIISYNDNQKRVNFKIGVTSITKNINFQSSSIKYYAECTLDNTSGNLINSSPVFETGFNKIFCKDKYYDWLISAFDEDGDELKYSLESCKTEDGVDVSSFSTPQGGYNSDYSPLDPLGIGASFSIDDQTGLISFTASCPEGAYWLAVKVEESRNGKVIGSARAEYWVVVSSECTNGDSPVFVDLNPAINGPSPRVTAECFSDHFIVEIDQRIQYGSWATDTSDVQLLDSDGNEMDDVLIYPINVEDNAFTQLRVDMPFEMDQNDCYELYIRNDGLYSLCGTQMPAGSLVTLCVTSCVTMPITINNVSVDECGLTHTIIWELKDSVDLLNTDNIESFKYWEIYACENALEESCTEYIGKTNGPPNNVTPTTDQYLAIDNHTTSNIAIDGATNYRVIAKINGLTTQLYSNMVNSILLEITDNTPDLDYAELAWSPYNAWADPVYEIEMSTDEANWITAETSSNPFFSLEKPGEIGTVFIRIKTTDGEYTSYSNCVSYDGSGSELIVPDIFTPNGDGVNDLFEIGNLKYWPGTYVTIYNRWGETVYKQENYQSTWSAKRVSDGIYFYVFYLNNRTKVSGYVTIMRYPLSLH